MCAPPPCLSREGTFEKKGESGTRRVRSSTGHHDLDEGLIVDVSVVDAKGVDEFVDLGRQKAGRRARVARNLRTTRGAPVLAPRARERETRESSALLQTKGASASLLPSQKKLRTLLCGGSTSVFIMRQRSSDSTQPRPSGSRSLKASKNLRRSGRVPVAFRSRV